MKNFNKISLAGYIAKEPVEVTPPEGANYAAECEIFIELANKSRPSRITVIVTDANAIVLQNAHKDDYIVVPSARLVTTNYRRTEETLCMSCNRTQDITFASEKTEVIANGKVEIIPKPRHKSLMGLNRVSLLGNICSNTNENFYKNPNGNASLQIKIAVDRPSWKVPEGSNVTADYPFALLFGKSAEFVHKYMPIGSLAFIEGFITEREVFMKKSPVCEHCGNTSESTIKNDVREVIVDQIIQFPKSYQVADVDKIKDDHHEFQNKPVDVTEISEPEEIKGETWDGGGVDGWDDF